MVDRLWIDGDPVPSIQLALLPSRDISATTSKNFWLEQGSDFNCFCTPSDGIWPNRTIARLASRPVWPKNVSPNRDRHARRRVHSIFSGPVTVAILRSVCDRRARFKPCGMANPNHVNCTLVPQTPSTSYVDALSRIRDRGGDCCAHRPAASIPGLAEYGAFLWHTHSLHRPTYGPAFPA